MTTRLGVAAVALGFFFAGCGPSMVVHKRGWVGGSFTQASDCILAKSYQDEAGGAVRAMPHGVAARQGRALVVSRLESEAPLAAGGVRLGDLITSVNGRAVKSPRSFYDAVDSVKPGTAVVVTVWREGGVLDVPVIVGSEEFRRLGYLKLGFGFGTTMKIIPDPDFNLFNLVRVAVPDRRNGLHVPEFLYLSSVKPDAMVNNCLWDVWLGVVGVARGEVIVAQSGTKENAALPEKVE